VAKRKKWTVTFDEKVVEHTKDFQLSQLRLLRHEIHVQLSFQPDVETQQRKPLSRPNVFGEAWELRCGPENKFRVFYRMSSAVKHVKILAIGVKLKGILYIGDKEIEL